MYSQYIDTETFIMADNELIAGRYKLQKKLSQDSIGTDYIAFDQPLETPVRLKHLHAFY